MSLVHVLAPVVRRPATAGAVVLAVAVAPTLAACAPGGAVAEQRADSRLAPRFDAQHGAKRRARQGERGTRGDAGGRDRGRTDAGSRQVRRDRNDAPTDRRTTQQEAPESAAAAPSSAPTTPSAPSSQPAPAGPLTAGLSDPRGDVGGGLGQAPAHVDVVAASVTREATGFTVRVVFAAALPRRAEGSQVENVAAFFDLDGDALVDYETWGTLGDDGWGSSYRTPDSAHFGDDSGVRTGIERSTLVMRFPHSHLEGARSFRWQVGAEWGTYEQVASGTTASDKGGEGGVAFPS